MTKRFLQASPLRMAFYFSAISGGLSVLQFWTPCRASSDVSGRASLMAAAALACGYVAYFRQAAARRTQGVKVAITFGWIFFILSVLMVH